MAHLPECHCSDSAECVQCKRRRAPRVQIAVLRTEKGGDGKPQKRWRFVAHGAPYSREDAESYVTQYGKAAVRLLPLPKGS